MIWAGIPAGTVYPGLTLAEVYSALAYFEVHRQEIVLAFAEEDRRVREFQDRRQCGLMVQGILLFNLRQSA